MPGQNHDAGVVDVGELEAEIGKRCDGKSRERQGCTRAQRRRRAQHGDDGGGRDHADHGGQEQAIPIRPYGEPVGPELDPILETSMTDTGKPHDERRQRQDNAPAAAAG